MSEPRDLNRRDALGLGLGTAFAATAAVAGSAAGKFGTPAAGPGAAPVAGAGSRPSGRVAPGAVVAATMRCWEVGDRLPGELTLRRATRPIPVPGPGQVLLKVLATGINAIDVGMMRGGAFKLGGPQMIPLQDNVSEVAALGPGVETLAIGDRVMTTLYIEWVSGPWNTLYTRSMPGLGIDGFLAEYALMPASTLVRVPDHFTNEEACTLAIAGLTAWRALALEARVKPGETVVTTGTGGVSTFNVQLAKLLGARVIVTSSSDEKLERMKALGADVTINYRTTPDWAQAVLDETGGRGAEVVLNNVGWPDMVSSLRACGSSARLVHIGASRERPVMTNWPNMILKNVWIKSFTMAGRVMLEHFLTALRSAPLKPVVDRVFPFEEAPEAVRFMESASHIGKIVIRIQGSKT